MPPANGFYLIFDPATASFIGLSDDNKTVVGYNSLEKAQVWEVRTGGFIFTTLRNGQTGGIQNVWESMWYTGITPVGMSWTMNYVSPQMWTISNSPNIPSYCLTAKAIGGHLPQNATVNFEYITPVGWLFLPQSTGESLQSALVFPPTIIGDFFSVSSATIRTITQDMLTAFKEGLQSRQTPLSSMMPSYVTLIPKGKERGPFLALTVAAELTVSYIKLNGKSGTERNLQRSFDLTPQQFALEATELFRYIAGCVKEAVVNDFHLSSSSEQPLYMGMVFPFPVDKTALNIGKLIHWTKEVSSGMPDSTVNQDVVQLLQNALDSEGLHIKCNALINDTTAVLLAHAYRSGGCEIGAIFDAGTNGAYIEKAENIKSLEGRSGLMVVNMEWGSFQKSESLQRTPFDYRIDRKSTYPRQQIFEKLVSTTAICEVTRHVLLYYIDTGIPPSPQQRPLFNRYSSTKLNTKDQITIELMWRIDNAEDGAEVKQLLVEDLDLPEEHVSEDDGKVVKGVCRAILLRTARLSACALAATLILMGRATLGGGVGQGGRIGINGSLTQSAAFRRDMEEALSEIIGADVAKKVLMVQVQDDRISLGAAVCAYMAEVMNPN